MTMWIITGIVVAVILAKVTADTIKHDREERND